MEYGTINWWVTGNDSSGQIIISEQQLECCGTFGMERTTVNQGTLRIQGRCPATGWGQLTLLGEFRGVVVVTGSFGGFGSTPSSIVVA